MANAKANVIKIWEYRNRFEYSSVAGLEKGQETESEYDITELQVIH